MISDQHNKKQKNKLQRLESSFYYSKTTNNEENEENDLYFLNRNSKTHLNCHNPYMSLSRGTKKFQNVKNKIKLT